MSTSCRVYVGNVPESASERDIEKFFDGYGKIREIMIKANYAFVELSDPRDAEDAVYDLNGKDLAGSTATVAHARQRRTEQYGQQSRGYSGYGGFGFSRGSDYYGGGGGYGGGGYGRRGGGGYGRGGFGGRGAYSGPRRNSNMGQNRTPYRLIVENLSSSVTWQELKDVMREVGEVRYTDANGRERNRGIVEFEKKRDMHDALKKFQGYKLSGRRIKLSMENDDRDSRSRSRSASRSRSRSPRRSRTVSRESSRGKDDRRSEDKEAEGKDGQTEEQVEDEKMAEEVEETNDAPQEEEAENEDAADDDE